MTGNNNVLLGASISTTINGDNNILLGYSTASPISNGSNQLNIGNLIFGTGLNGSV